MEWSMYPCSRYEEAKYETLKVRSRKKNTLQLGTNKICITMMIWWYAAVVYWNYFLSQIISRLSNLSITFTVSSFFCRCCCFFLTHISYLHFFLCKITTPSFHSASLLFLYFMISFGNKFELKAALLYHFVANLAHFECFKKLLEMSEIQWSPRYGNYACKRRITAQTDKTFNSM